MQIAEQRTVCVVFRTDEIGNKLIEKNISIIVKQLVVSISYIACESLTVSITVSVYC